MTELKYQVSFTTPAFLGNAEQQAQWRTPPFKALIRQWWRVVKAPRLRPAYDVNELRKAEGELFGMAADDGGESRQSRVRLRLKHWDLGQLDNDKWPRAEIKGVDVGQGRSIPADVYIGYGPVLAASRRENRPNPVLGRRAVNPADTKNGLRLGFARDASDEQIAEVHKAIMLANWFGGIGSRSRNGWGSITFSGESIPALPQSIDQLKPFLRPFEDCLKFDWPHAIGADQHGPLVWAGRSINNWREAIFALADTRRAIRGAAKTFGRGTDISANQLVAYPVTQSGNQAWGEKERIAGSLRLKVMETGQGLVPIAVHLPCTVPALLLDKLSGDDQRWIAEHQAEIWRAVHRALGQRMTRLGGAS